MTVGPASVEDNDASGRPKSAPKPLPASFAGLSRVRPRAVKCVGCLIMEQRTCALLAAEKRRLHSADSPVTPELNFRLAISNAFAFLALA